MKLDFKNNRFLASIIINAIRLYVKYKLSLRNISKLLLEIDINVSSKNTRKWLNKFSPQMTKILKEKHKNFGRK